jgi:predicted phosphodiesterase
MAAEILFVGDMHLGRRPRRLPRDLEEYGVSTAALTPTAAFQNVVRYAETARVSAVVFAGDVVQSENSRFEAYGQLHRGVTQLTEHGIEVLAVAGNHDVDALPRLADSIDGFRLLGRGGRWEERILRVGGRPVARLLGWSFPSAVHRSSPLAQPDFPRRKPDDGLPLLGLLHCDLLAADSPYAPVAPSELERSVADGWLLGHIHKPSSISGPRPIGYLGSLVGLDPGETGAHGPWLLRLGSAGGIEIEQLPLAPMRWEKIDAPIDGLTDADSIERAIRGAIESLAERPRPAGDLTRVVGCRIRLTGSVRRLDALRTIEASEVEQLRIQLGQVLYFVDRVENATTAEIDLASLAAQDDPPGILAARLLMLERDEGEARLWIQHARRELQRTADDRRWSRLENPQLDEAAVRRLLIDAGTRALAELLEQTRESRS